MSGNVNNRRVNRTPAQDFDSLSRGAARISNDEGTANYMPEMRYSLADINSFLEAYNQLASLPINRSNVNQVPDYKVERVMGEDGALRDTVDMGGGQYIRKSTPKTASDPMPTGGGFGGMVGSGDNGAWTVKDVIDQEFTPQQKMQFMGEMMSSMGQREEIDRVKNRAKKQEQIQHISGYLEPEAMKRLSDALVENFGMHYIDKSDYGQVQDGKVIRDVLIPEKVIRKINDAIEKGVFPRELGPRLFVIMEIMDEINKLKQTKNQLLAEEGFAMPDDELKLSKISPEAEKRNKEESEKKEQEALLGDLGKKRLKQDMVKQVFLGSGPLGFIGSALADAVPTLAEDWNEKNVFNDIGEKLPPAFGR